MTLLQDLRYAVRMLLKDPWFTAVAAVALGLGIGVNTTVFTFVNAVLIRGLPFDRPEEIVFLATRNTTGRRRQQLAGVVAGVRGLARQGAVVLGPGGVPATAVERQRPGPPGRAGQRRRGHGQHVRPAAAAAVPRPGLRAWRGRRGRGAGRHPRPQRLEEPLRRATRPSSAVRSKINEVAYAIIGVMPEGMRFPTNADMWRPLQPPDRRDAPHQPQHQRLRPPGARRHLEPGGDRDGRRSRASCKPPTRRATRTSKPA